MVNTVPDNSVHSINHCHAGDSPLWVVLSFFAWVSILLPFFSFKPKTGILVSFQNFRFPYTY